MTNTQPATQAQASGLFDYDLAEYLRTPQGMTQLVREAGLSRESLYRALSAEGNPSLATVLKVINPLGLQLHGKATAADA